MQLNAAVARIAAAHGALLVDLRGFGARNLVMADRVHPTAFGQMAIAERALAVLERDGLPTRVAPSLADQLRDDARAAGCAGPDLHLPVARSSREARR